MKNINCTISEVERKILDAVAAADKNRQSIIKTEKYTNAKVDQAKLILDVDPESDILFNHHFFRILFTPEKIESKYSQILIPRCREHGILIGDADNKAIAEMVFEAYRIIGSVDMPSGTTRYKEMFDEVFHWMQKRSREISDEMVDELIDDMIYDLYAFNVMKRPIFIDQMIPVRSNTDKLRREFLYEHVDRDSVTTVYDTKQNRTKKCSGTATEIKDKKAKHKNDDNLVKSYDVQANVKAVSYDTINDIVNAMGVIDGSTYVKSVKNVIDAYGGDKPSFKTMIVKSLTNYMRFHNVAMAVMPHYDILVQAVSLNEIRYEESIIKEMFKLAITDSCHNASDYEVMAIDNYKANIPHVKQKPLLTWNERVQKTKIENPRNENESDEDYEARINDIIGKQR